MFVITALFPVLDLDSCRIYLNSQLKIKLNLFFLIMKDREQAFFKDKNFRSLLDQTELSMQFTSRMQFQRNNPNHNMHMQSRFHREWKNLHTFIRPNN